MTVRHQVIKSACDKFDVICEQEDQGIRPIHRSRHWKADARRKEKERKVQNWHKSQKDQISAPLIIDPTSGTITRDMKDVCKRFESVTGMRLVVRERAGDSVKNTAKAEPLRNRSCGRTDYFPCTTGGVEKCE